jgi:hypothetical protein
MGGDRVPRIVRPGVFGVAPCNSSSPGGSRFPEPRQIPGNLNRASCGGQKMDEDASAALNAYLRMRSSKARNVFPVQKGPLTRTAISVRDIQKGSGTTPPSPAPQTPRKRLRSTLKTSTSSSRIRPCPKSPASISRDRFIFLFSVCRNVFAGDSDTRNYLFIPDYQLRGRR